MRRARTGQNAAPDVPALLRADLCRKLRYRAADQLIVLAVDTSESMGSGALVRMRAAKGAALAILRRAYQTRSSVALIAFGGERAALVLPPTRSINLARTRLERLPTGGATPMADALVQARELILRERRRCQGLRPVLVLVSDGEANVPLVSGRPAVQELHALAVHLRQDRIPGVIIDVLTEGRPGTLLGPLAARMGMTHLRVTDLNARLILQAVRATQGA